MRFTSALLASALLAFTVSSSPVDTAVKRTYTAPACSTPQQYSAYGGYEGLSDTEFVNNPEFSWKAQAAGWYPPSGYTKSFSDLKAASLVNNNYDHYKLTYLSSYDYWKCAKLCDEEKDFKCKGFNIYYERDPKYQVTKSDQSDCPNKKAKRTSTPAPEKDCCPNPPSITQIKCVELSYAPTKENAVNYGQYRNQFHVVIAGSDGFTKTPPTWG